METETKETIYTETTGTTCYLGGMRGTVTGLRREMGGIVAAFVKLDGGGVLYVSLGGTTGDRGQRHGVTGWRSITRDEFDRITGLDAIRFEMGWR